MFPSGQRAKVFVVDDDGAVRDSLVLLLESYGFDVESHASIDSFIRSYHEPVRGCLILDQHFPGQTGLDFLTSVPGRNLHIPVIFTGHGTPALRQRALASGAAAYLEKPIEGAVLLQVIHQFAQ